LKFKVKAEKLKRQLNFKKIS